MKKLINLFILLSLWSCAVKETELPKPNILWITSEDMTTMLGVYGDPNAHTPNLDAYAAESVQYTNAFATAPVCSPSRSCLITGFYASSLGSQHLRSTIELPEQIVPFPKYLREAGYFTTNNAKEDYNFIDSTIWDISSHEAHWRKRNDNQPFFSVFNLMLTHQSSIFGDDSTYEARVGKYLPFVNRTSPDSLVLPPYYPDTPGIRKLWARYYTNVSIIDYQFSQIIKELEEDGLADNTIVFFYSDHGTGMPRSKRALYDSGLKIPLLVHLPEKYAGKYKLKPGSVEEGMVSFIDFAPTVLEIAGLELPEHYEGKPFIIESPVARKAYVFGTSDRVDEGYEMSRTIRTNQYRYVRNFLPHLPLLQPNFYTDQSEIMRELNQVRNTAALTAEQMTMFARQRLPEELYDVGNDPHEVYNLANDPQYKDVLIDLRKTLVEEIIKTFDTGFMPEPEMIRLAQNSTPFEVAHDAAIYPLKEIVDACQLMLEAQPSPEKILENLEHSNGFVRYWTVTTVQQKEMKNQEIIQKLHSMLDDSFATVQVEAAKTLVKLGEVKGADTIIKHMKTGDDPLVLFASRAFQEIAGLLPKMPEEARGVYEKMKEETNDGDMRSDYYKLYAYWALTDVFNGLQ